LEGTSKHLRYFITLACYGAHVHGDAAGTVDLRHNVFGSRVVDEDQRRAEAERSQMEQQPYLLTAEAREVVLIAIREVCVTRGWTMLAAHVRSTHVHVVVEAEARPEIVMRDFKAYASRKLNQLGNDAKDRKRWARHDSTRWLWTDDDVKKVMEYVVDEQGTTLAAFWRDEW
jgi:REP element-mobilizing transposase RayT